MVTPILSLSFDSLWNNIQNFPPQCQVEIVLQISGRDEKDIGGMQKQEKLLLEIIPFSSKKEKRIYYYVYFNFMKN